MSEEIDLTMWIAIEQQRLEDFRLFWAENMEDAPDEFPEKLPLGEWDEQYRAFEDI